MDAVFWGVITFSVLVVLHELGHFLAARSFGVKVHEFMLGLPGPALRLRTKNMAWGITAIPFGGYVKIAGMEPGTEDELLGPALRFFRETPGANAHALARELGIDQMRAEDIVHTLRDWKAIEQADDGACTLTLDGDVGDLSETELVDSARSVTYRGKSTPKRMAILAMGVVANLVVAILVFTIVLSAWGYEELTNDIGTVAPGSPAAQAGLQTGDTLVALDGEPIGAWESFLLTMARTEPGQTVVVTVERDGRERDIEAVLSENEGHGYLGVGPATRHVELTVFQSLWESFRLTGLVFRAILDLFNPETFATTMQGVRGVVGVSVMAADAARAGALSYASLVAMLSLSVGLMNILPIPPLDGGKMVVELVERAMGRPINRALNFGLNVVGAVLLFSLLGYVMYADIVRIAS